MRRGKSFIKQWRTAELHEMIACPYQPGSLKILKKSCLVRRRASTEGRSHKIIQNDFFLFSVKQGLMTCKNCPVGD
jgi:uncharacterized protein YbaR (Trm112 family)